MAKTGFAGNPNSSYDPGLVVKEVHDFWGQYIRVRDTKSVVTSYFSHFRTTYNSINQPTAVSYYRGTKEHTTSVGCLADSSGSLNNKYFIIRNDPDNALYHVWFNVNGAGTDPSPSNSTGIEIPIDTNDSADIVATAIKLVINSLFSSVFSCIKIGSVVEIKTTGLGLITNSADFNSGFTISNVAGAQELVTQINISYQNGNPVYNGQELIGYVFNPFTGNFDLRTTATDESLRVDEVSSSLIYVGSAVTGSAESSPVWKIFQVAISGGAVSIKYADGSTSYDNAWTSRGSLTYV
jgi:hypothetical protein